MESAEETREMSSANTEAYAQPQSSDSHPQSSLMFKLGEEVNEEEKASGLEVSQAYNEEVKEAPPLFKTST